MNDTFFSYMLTLILATILILYLSQLMQKNKPVIKRKEPFLPVIYDVCTNERTGTMPVHRVGPVQNFHQSFNKYNSALVLGTPTGIPEMGWRNFYLTNFNNNMVTEKDPFAGTIVRNYLDNLDNVNNLYRECN